MTMVGGQSMKEMFIKIQIKFPFRCKQFEIITRQNRWKIIQIYMDIYIEEKYIERMSEHAPLSKRIMKND